MLVPIEELRMRGFEGHNTTRTFRAADKPDRVLGVDYERQVVVIGEYEYPMAAAERWRPSAVPAYGQPVVHGGDMATISVTKRTTAPEPEPAKKEKGSKR